MASESEGIGESPKGLELADSIKKIAATNARASLNDEKQLLLFLQSWWSKTYNRPLKDPLLQTYTLEELLYEFWDKVERNAAADEHEHGEEVKTEEIKEKDVLDWIDKEEKKEAATLANKAKAKPADPTKDPDNVKWMEEEIRKAKTHLGDDFGEDLELSFDEK